MSGQRVLTILTGILVLALSGCSRAEDPHIDHTEAMSELNGLFEITQDAAGGEWEAGNDGRNPATFHLAPWECVTSSPDTGRHFLLINILPS
jgi:hypothetical protein